MLDLTKPVQTRDGTAVRILCKDAKGHYPIVGLWDDDGEEKPQTWSALGEYYIGDSSKDDLVNVKTKVVKYIGVYKHNFNLYTTKVYNTKEEIARMFEDSNCEVLCIQKVKWEE